MTSNVSAASSYSLHKYVSYISRAKIALLTCSAEKQYLQKQRLGR
jgi:hypothetical protein